MRRANRCCVRLLCLLATSLIAAAGLPALAARADAAPKAGGKRLNILFLLTDDQRPDTIHALGNRQIKTPNLDRLAERGFVFRNASIMGAMQGAVCVPSRAMLLSGRSLWRVPEDLKDVPIWPEVMRRAGYTTFGTGKWHNGPASHARAFGRGGAIFFGGMSDQARIPVFDFDPAGRYAKKNQRIAEKFSSELFADTAIEFLRGYKGDEPFVLYVAFTAPHDPRTPPKPYADLYDPEKIELPKNFLPEHPFDNGELRVRDELLAPFPRTPEVIRRHIADYYGMISHVDAQIGRILKALEETGHADDTLVFFAGDNGLALGSHGLMGKQNLYDHSQRVPLLVAGPGVLRGRSDALVYLYDLFPTICELAGLKTPEGVEGKTLVPILRGQQTKVRDFLVGAYRNWQRSIRDERWKLIQYDVKGVRTTQLFDLEDDPCETRNLAADPRAAKHLKRLEVLLKMGLREAGDPVLPSDAPRN